MKNIYISPSTEVLTIAARTVILAGSPTGFTNPVDDDPIDSEEILSREKHRSAWDDDEDDDF